MSKFWQGRRVLITGVCGTVGQEVLRQVLEAGADHVVGIDNHESGLFFLRQSYDTAAPVDLRLADIRDRESLTSAMQDVEIVLHTAAYKHVDLCERSPRAAINTNILGSQNVIDVAAARGIERVLFTSSDKAVNPTSVMGTSKLMCERLFTAASDRAGANGTIFASVRFGNVLGSSGSVIPLFTQQIAAGGPVTLTDPAMTRFIMTLRQAVAHVMDSCVLSQGGEVFVTKMPVVRIDDLAKVMIGVLAPRFGHAPDAIAIREIGMRPGEKLYEELMSEEEVRRTMEAENFFIIQPALRGPDQPARSYPGIIAEGGRPYRSADEETMAGDTLRAYLVDNDLLSDRRAAAAEAEAEAAE